MMLLATVCIQKAFPSSWEVLLVLRLTSGGMMRFWHFARNRIPVFSATNSCNVMPDMATILNG